MAVKWYIMGTEDSALLSAGMMDRLRKIIISRVEENSFESGFVSVVDGEIVIDRPPKKDMVRLQTKTIKDAYGTRKG